MIDTVEHGLDGTRFRARPDELLPDVLGDGDHLRKQTQNLLVHPVVQQTLAPAVPCPPMGRRERNHSLCAMQQPREHVCLVVVGMDDVDAAVLNEPAKHRPDGAIEGMALDNLHVIDRQIARLLIDGEDRISGVPYVTDRDRVPARIAACRSQENRFLRSSASPPHAPQLEHADRSHCAATISAGALRWGGRITRASARPRS